jgi:ABC-type lipoprotein release transport system permease subunit
MKLPLYIAFRYLFSKKTHNTINIISLICACGICVATIALVCVLSVFNGFQELIGSLYNHFDPDLKITLVEGKTFETTIPKIEEVKSADFVSIAAIVLEDNALIKNGDKQTAVTIKGVSPEYLNLIAADSVIYDGNFTLQRGNENYTVIGAALASQIEAGVFFVHPVSFFAPKYKAKVNLSNPERAFNEKYLYVSGIYNINQEEIDGKYAFVSLPFAQGLFEYGNKATAIEIKLTEGTSIKQAKKELQQIMGNDFKVQGKEELHDFYKMLKIEKWITFLILAFIVLIAVFNVIGSLTMLILEKKDDIRTLRSLGANSRLIRTIFLFEGWLVTVFGVVSGIVIGLVACLAQQIFGIIKLHSNGMENAFIVQSYPVSVVWSDILIIFVTVLLIGFIVVWYPTRYAANLKKD